MKDVLRHEAAMEHAHQTREQSAEAAAPVEDWRDRVWNLEENAAGLEVVLEEALSRFKAIAEGFSNVSSRMLGRHPQRNPTRPRTRGDAAFDRAEEYELRADEG